LHTSNQEVSDRTESEKVNENDIINRQLGFLGRVMRSDGLDNIWFAGNAGDKSAWTPAREVRGHSLSVDIGKGFTKTTQTTVFWQAAQNSPLASCNGNLTVLRELYSVATVSIMELRYTLRSSVLAAGKGTHLVKTLPTGVKGNLRPSTMLSERDVHSSFHCSQPFCSPFRCSW